MTKENPLIGKIEQLTTVFSAGGYKSGKSFVYESKRNLDLMEQLLTALGQLGALEQASRSLIGKWRIRGHDVADQCADELTEVLDKVK